MNVFVSVTKYNGQAVVEVRYGQNRKWYPLTKAGCLSAGNDLFHSGAESWMNSSSVDFPQEVKRSFKHDVRQLLQEGFQNALDEQTAPRKAMITKAMAFLHASDAFLTSLDNAEYEAWQEMCEQHKG